MNHVGLEDEKPSPFLLGFLKVTFQGAMFFVKLQVGKNLQVFMINLWLLHILNVWSVGWANWVHLHFQSFLRISLSPSTGELTRSNDWQTDSFRCNKSSLVNIACVSTIWTRTFAASGLGVPERNNTQTPKLTETQKNTICLLPSRIIWGLTNGPLSKLLGLLDTQV